jgi:hypothetical protein
MFSPSGRIDVDNDDGDGSRQSGTRSVAGVGAVETEAEAGEWLSDRAPLGERDPEDKHDDFMVVMPCSDGGST